MIKFVILGILQGVTEFLPISSSGHLFLFKKIMSVNQPLLAFFVYLHFATLLAVCLYLRKEIISALFKRKLLIHIGLATVISAIFGLPIGIFLEKYFQNQYLIAGLLMVNAFILFSSRKGAAVRRETDINIVDSLVVGLLQGLSALPGISRSGITITWLLRRGFSKPAAFTMSFLMAIPAICGLLVLEAKSLSGSKLLPLNIFLGGAAAFLFGLLALSVLQKTVINNKFSRFAYYCLAVSLLVLIFGGHLK